MFWDEGCIDTGSVDEGSVRSRMNDPFVTAPEIDLLFLPPTCLEIDHEPFLHRFFAVTGPHYYKYMNC
jgi:hypothetical protein